jgi:adenylate kinase
LEEYAKKTAQVADHYAKFNKVSKVKGEGSIENIFDALAAEIEAKQPA